MATNTPTPVELSDSVEDKVNPRCKPVGDGKYRSREDTRLRLNKWAEDVAIANADPDTVMRMGQQCVVVEIGPPQFADDREIWDQQPDEDGNQWRMFQMYRDMEPWKRSKQQVQRQIGVAYSNGTGQAIGHASTHFRWEERIQAFDAAEDRRMTEELYQRKLRARIATADVGQDMRLKAADALSVMATIIYRWVENEHGKKVRVKRSALKPNEVVRLAEIGVKLERLGLGENDSEFGSAVMNLTQINQTVNVTDQELVDQAHAIITARERDSFIVGADGRANMDGK